MLAKTLLDSVKISARYLSIQRWSRKISLHRWVKLIELGWVYMLQRAKQPHLIANWTRAAENLRKACHYTVVLKKNCPTKCSGRVVICEVCDFYRESGRWVVGLTVSKRCALMQQARLNSYRVHQEARSNGHQKNKVAPINHWIIKLIWLFPHILNFVIEIMFSLLVRYQQ